MASFREISDLWYVVVLLLSAIFLSGLGINALPYDYTASVECLLIPHKPQYNGGIIRNPELNNGSLGWFKFGNPEIDHRSDIYGNNFIVAHSRQHPYDSVSHKIYLQRDKLYTFSAWIQVSEGKIPVRAVFKTRNGFKHAGAVIAQPNCWSMLKGGVTVDASGLAELYFEAEDTSVEIRVDSISLQPFTYEEWKSHQDQSVEESRKSRVKLHVVDKDNKALPYANITIELANGGFPFGCAINRNILTNQAYQSWFTSRFSGRVTTFEDEMKWYTTEPTSGKEDYSVPDAMMKFTQQNRVRVRGHNILWDDPQYQQDWVKNLDPKQLWEAATKRVNSVMNKYKGQVIAWDVVNENLHFSFLEGKLGPTASAAFYQTASMNDRGTTLFLNEYNTIEDSSDNDVKPAKYIQKINEILSYGKGKKNMGIGLESHFNVPNLPYMRSTLDTLAATGLPIWLTEVDVQSSPNQAQYLEQVLREGHGHKGVNGIVVWGAWRPQGCYKMCLTDNNFQNLATGDVVDKLLKEWSAAVGLLATTDTEGFVEASLFHGQYQVKIRHPSIVNSEVVQSVEVAAGSQERILLKFSV